VDSYPKAEAVLLKPTLVYECGYPYRVVQSTGRENDWEVLDDNKRVASKGVKMINIRRREIL
jgi:hypothetical protein